MPELTLSSALDAARRQSPELRAAREAVVAASARARQAGVLRNPLFSYGREQTSASGVTSSQDIAELQQPLELGGQRSARLDAARLRVRAAEARLDEARSEVDLTVVRAYVLAVAAERRAQLADQAHDAFVQAQRASDRRLAAGDVSGYAARRLRLESARHAAMRAEAALSRSSARRALTSLMGQSARSAITLVLPIGVAQTGIGDSVPLRLDDDSLTALATRRRAELRAATLDAEAAAADARLVSRERIPVPVLSAGYKRERVTTDGSPASGSASGFVAGIEIPLAILDRREGAVAASAADARRALAELDALRRRISREVADAAESVRAAEQQRDALAPHVGESTRVAMRAVQTSYAEGEITLVEWLDAVRAWQDAESTIATLEAEVIVRRAALARAAGLPILPNSDSGGADASAVPPRTNRP